MARKRMFSPEVLQNENFLQMPVSSRELYVHLNLQADDDGFVSPQGIMRMVNATTDDLKILVAKNFLIQIENTLTLISHWKINNCIRKDRYYPSPYKKLLENIRCINNVYLGIPDGIPYGDVESKVVRKIEGENTSKNEEETGREAENLKNEEEKRKIAEGIQNEIQKINLAFGKVPAEVLPIIRYEEPQEHQGEI